MLTKHKTAFLLLFLIIAALFAMRALFHPGLYTSHDIWHQVARLYHFDQAIRDGQFPPRWSGGLLFGFGYPIFIYSYHLPWWIAEIFVLAGMSLFDSIKLVFVLTYLLSGITMFYFASNVFGRKAGFVAAFIYLFTPYRFANILVRANIGESVSYLFLPLLFWSFYIFHKKHSSLTIVLGAISIAGILLSNVMILVLFSIPLILFLLYGTYLSKKKLQYLFSVLMTGILGIGLASYYLLPALFYKPITVFKDIYQHLYRSHFTPFAKLAYSPWGFGALGTPGEMSRQVGLTLWLVIGFSFCLIIFFILKRRKQVKKQLFLALIMLTSFLIAIFMMVKDSLPLWKTIESFSLIDFPWRFLSLTTFTGAVLSGFFIKNISHKLLKNLLIIFILCLAFYSNRNHQKVNQYTDIPLSLYVESETTTNTDDEYLPKWVNREQTKKAHPLVTFSGTIENKQQTSDSISFDYVSNINELAKIHHMYFPGWFGYIDGNSVLLNKSDYGGIEIELPQGRHHVALSFQPTIPMRIGELFTLIALFSCILLVYKEYKYHKK